MWHQLNAKKNADVVKADRKVTITQNKHTLQQWYGEEHL